MLIQAQVGPAVSSTSLGAGTNPNLRLDNMGGLTVTQLNPRYYEETYRRQTYTVSNQSAVATTAGLAQTYTGLVIANPTTSTVNAVVTKCGFSSIVAQTSALAVGLMTGSGASITSGLTARNRFVGSVGSQCLASQGSLTLPSVPILETVLGTIQTGALTTVSVAPVTNIDLEGSLILPPGAYVAFYTSSASVATSMLFSFQWVEVPL